MAADWNDSAELLCCGGASIKKRLRVKGRILMAFRTMTVSGSITPTRALHVHE